MDKSKTRMRFFFIIACISKVATFRKIQMRAHRPLPGLLTRALRTAGPVLIASLLFGACAAGHGPRGVYIDFMRPDQRPPSVGAEAAADSLWGPIEESERGDGIAESRRADLQALVERFTPTLVLPKADHVKVNGRRYQLLPTNASLVPDTLQLDRIRAAADRAFSPSPYIDYGHLFP